MKRSFRIALPALFLLIGGPLSSRRVEAQQSCRVAGESMSVTGLPEASGVAASLRTAGMLWSHNDSGEPVVFAVGSDGATIGRVTIAGASVGDWEDIDVGPCSTGSCLYIGDIGDNFAKRKDVVIYRVPEPEANAGTSAPAESMHLTYPDGPRDAEALVVLPNGTLFIVTKGERGPIALYRLPSEFRDGATAQLERVATVAESEGMKGVSRQDRITGGAASPDGRWIALRTLHAVTFYSAVDFTAGNVREVLRFDVSSLRERQGEGVGFGADGTIWLASEGGGNRRKGSIARLECSLR